MSEAIDSDTGGEIQKLAILYIPEPRSLTLDKNRRRTGVCSNHVGSVLVDDGGALGLGRGVGVGERREGPVGDPRARRGGDGRQSASYRKSESHYE